MKLALVEWIDSATYNGWHYLNSKDDCTANCISIGLLCQEDDKQVSIALSKSEGGRYGDAISIPKIAIKRIRYLKVR